MPRKKDKIDKLFREYFGRGRMQGVHRAHMRMEHSLAEPVAPYSPPEMLPFVEILNKLNLRAVCRTGACPPLETLAGLIDGTLDEKLAARTTDHIARCRKCLARVKEGSLAVKEHESGKTPSVPDDISSETSSKLTELHEKSLTPRKKGKRL